MNTFNKLTIALAASTLIITACDKEDVDPTKPQDSNAQELITTVVLNGYNVNNPSLNQFSIKWEDLDGDGVPDVLATVNVWREIQPRGHTSKRFPAAYAKSQLAIDYSLPVSGTAFVSVCDRDKRQVVSVVKHLQMLGFEIISTKGTAKTLKAAGIPVREVMKKHEGRPNVLACEKSRSFVPRRVLS